MQLRDVTDTLLESPNYHQLILALQLVHVSTRNSEELVGGRFQGVVKKLSVENV